MLAAKQGSDRPRGADRSTAHATVARSDLLLRLASARDFVEVAELVCGFGHEAVATCRVTLHAADGRPVLGVDNCSLHDTERLAYLRDGWREDPLLAALREQEAAVEDARPQNHALLLPLHAADGLLGAVLFARQKPLSPTLRRDLAMVTGRAAVRLARLGIDVPMCGPMARLTARQCDVALMAATGIENADIGTALGISRDTVKKHLKDIFYVLAVSNRTELARVVGNRAMPTDLPVGITRRGSVTITRP